MSRNFNNLIDQLQKGRIGELTVDGSHVCNDTTIISTGNGSSATISDQISFGVNSSDDRNAGGSYHFRFGDFQPDFKCPEPSFFSKSCVYCRLFKNLMHTLKQEALRQAFNSLR